MPSANTQTCSQCQQKPAKYTCPKCIVRTCSLDCTKAHKDSEGVCRPISLPIQSQTQTKMESSSSSFVSRSQQPPITSYVPMSTYSEKNLLQDYTFLNRISQTTQEAGRQLVKMNLVSPYASHSSTFQESEKRLSNSQRQREALLKQIHFRRLNLMLLPDGMAQRKANQTAWNNKERKMTYTVQLVYPDTKRKEILHKQDGNLSVQDVFLSELEKISFSRKQVKASNKEKEKEKEKKKWMVSKKVLEEIGLPLPSSSSAVVVSSEEEKDNDRLVLDQWPTSWIVLLPVHQNRLTNETTTKYLDWWNRKQEKEKMTQSEQEKSNNRDHVIQDRIISSVTAPSLPPQQSQQQQLNQPDQPPLNPLISSQLLKHLSQQLGRTPTSSSVSNYFHDSIQSTSSLPSPSPPPPPTAPTSSSSHLPTYIQINPIDSIEQLILSLPTPYSVIEYPIFHLFSDFGFSRFQKQKTNHIIPLPLPTSPYTESIDLQPVCKKRKLSNQISPLPSTPLTLLGLVGYDSDQSSSSSDQ